jgi:hypothetical protein
MSTTITKGVATVTPITVTGYSSTRTTGNILHDVIGRSDVDVTFKAAGLRKGTLEMVFPSLTTVLAAESLHASIGINVLADSDLPALGMRYVASGDITVTLHDESRDFWLLSVAFQEVV